MSELNDQINEIYGAVEYTQKKIIQFGRIKQGLDVRRDKYISSLRADSFEDKSETIKLLYDNYLKQISLLKIAEKGLAKLEALEQSAGSVAKKAGFIGYFGNIVKLKAPDAAFAKIPVMSYAFKKIKKFILLSKKEYTRINDSINSQFKIIRKMVESPHDLKLKKELIELYDSETKGIKDFYSKRLNDKVYKIVNTLSPGKAAILVGLFNLPASGQVIPVTMPFVGVYTAILLGVLSETLKWGLFSGYLMYANKKNK
jgi:hypothetical protein